MVPTLEEAGAVERTVEYNGHFGRNIFFATETEIQATKVLEVLEKLLS